MIEDGTSRWFAAEVEGLQGGLALSSVSARLSAIKIGINFATGTTDTVDWAAEAITIGGAVVKPIPGGLTFAGTIEDLEVADILSGSATFAAAIASGLTTFTLTATDLRIGDALKLTTGSFALAHRDGTIAAIASNLSGTLALGGVLTATLSGGGLKVNRGSFDWSTAPVGDINFAAPIAEATGTLSALEIAGFASAAGSFTLTTTPELTDLALTLTSFRIGEAAGPRLTASGTLALQQQAGQLKVTGTLAGAELEGVNDFTVTLTDASLEIDTATGLRRAKGTLTATLGQGTLAGSFFYERQNGTTVVGLRGRHGQGRVRRTR